jgi:predicted PurR-regulated permease PerM
MERLASVKEFVDRAVETSIQVSLVILLAIACLLILRPFALMIAWGAIIAVAVNPLYQKLRVALGGRGVLSATLITAVLLAILIVPTVWLTGTIANSVQNLAIRLKEGTFTLPPLAASVETWPIIGVRLKNAWTLVSTDVSSALRIFAPQLKAIVPSLLSASAGIGLAVLEFAASIVVAGFLLANERGVAKVAHSLACHLFGDKGPEFEQLVCSAIRSVTTGILGVALIQSALATLGFVVARLPGAGLWSIIFLCATVLQLGTLVLIPAVIYMFAISSVTKSVIFTIWCVVIAVIDNVMKPFLLGRGVAVPIVVVFLGAIGGFITMGTIGLFIGATVLPVGYKLFLAWLDRTPAVTQG